MKTLLTVLISTRSRPELSMTLLSLLQQSYQNWKLDLVYGDFGNGLGRVNEQVLGIVQEKHEVGLFEFGKDTNFLANMNKVVDKITTKYMMRLDDDIVLKPNYIEKLIPFLDKRKVGAVTGFVETLSSDFWVGVSNLALAEDLSVLQKTFINDFDFDKGLLQPLFHRGHISMDAFKRKWYYSGTFPTDAVLLKTKVMKVSRFDENLAQPHFCDDLDLSFSVRHMGYQIIFVPSARCIHLYSEDKRRIVDRVTESKLFDYLRNKWTGKVGVKKKVRLNGRELR